LSRAFRRIPHLRMYAAMAGLAKRNQIVPGTVRWVRVHVVYFQHEWTQVGPVPVWVLVGREPPATAELASPLRLRAHFLGACRPVGRVWVSRRVGAHYASPPQCWRQRAMSACLLSYVGWRLPLFQWYRVSFVTPRARHRARFPPRPAKAPERSWSIISGTVGLTTGGHRVPVIGQRPGTRPFTVFFGVVGQRLQ